MLAIYHITVPPEAGGDAPVLVTAKLSTAPAKKLTFVVAFIAD